MPPDEPQSVGPPKMSTTPTPSEETESILSLVDNNGFNAFQLVAQQINVSHNHASSLVQLVAIVTAISGALLPGSSMPSDAKWVALAGFSVIILSGGIAVAGVLRPTWVTEFKPSQKEAYPREMIKRAIKFRQSKSKCVWLSGVVLLIGFAFYAASLFITVLR